MELGVEKQSKTKNLRHRKKKFYNSIRGQMEFYFGDANLSKDRFLMKLIKQNPFVSLETFLSFNKLKVLTDSVDDIAKAIGNSSLLELSDDKKKVRRRTEIPKDRNVDDKTIYVESLPPHADHDWVIKVFGRYGPIAYASLPKYKKSRKIKEFGFVEFEDESSVIKVLKAFKEFDGVLCPELLDPSNLISVKSFIKEQNEEKSDSVRSNTSNDSNVDESIDKESNAKINVCQISDTLKRKKDNESSCDENDLFPSKKIKNLKEYNEGEELVSDCSENESSDDGLKTNKKKNRKNRKKKNLNTIDESELRELKILAKKDWKRLRNTYLNMQREKIKEFKRIRNRSQPPFQKSQECSNLKANFKQQTQNVNFYCANENLNTDCCIKTESEKTENETEFEKTESERNLAERKEPLFKFEPGLIMRIKFIEPCVDIKNFKADMKQYNCIKYVDVKEGALESFIRCDSALNAESLLKQITCAEYQCQILTGNEEENYWRKIMEDREMKLNKKIKVKQKRGREKVVKAISKHIRFDDE